MQKLMQILRLNDFEKIGNIIVTYQMDHKILLCEYPVINTLMLVHQWIIIVQILCMWLSTIIAFDYYTTLLQISFLYFMSFLQCSKGNNNISFIEATMLQVQFIIEGNK